MSPNTPEDPNFPTEPVARHTLPLPTPPAWLGWIAAAVFFFAAIFFAAKSFNVRGDLQAALDAERVARLEAGTLKNLLTAEHILSRAQLDRLIEADHQIVELRAQAEQLSAKNPPTSNPQAVNATP